MSPDILKFIGQLVLVFIGGGALVAAINNWLSPKAKAETRQIAQQAAQQEVNARIQNLKDAIDEANERADDSDRRATAAQTRADEISQRINTLQATVESAHEQIDLQAEQLAELRKQNKQLSEQNRMLSESLFLAEQHTRRYFAARGEAIPSDWPRTVPFDVRKRTK